MRIYTSYSAKIKQYNNIFRATLCIYRDAVDFLIGVCLSEWDALSFIEGDFLRQQYVEKMCHATASNTDPKYRSFDRRFYKFPSYLRRGAINEAIGKVSSYKSNLELGRRRSENPRQKTVTSPGGEYLSLHVQDKHV